jgi:tetratricopeptide (TPR) repeat protein
MRHVAWFCAFLLWPTVAQAAWLEASSAHFVVYAEDREDNLRAFAERLERYHAAMELVTGHKTSPPSPSNRLTVYVVKSEKEVRELAKSDDSNLEAFYLPRAGGSLAVVPPQGKADDDGQSQTALLHEYAHHFLISASGFSMPLWFSEGAAEFFSAVSFKKDGGMGLGEPANGRIDELAFAKQITARDVLDTSTDATLGGSYLGFYAKSWQLYHYLIFDTQRDGQLAQYMAEMAAGMSSLDAATKVFGNLDTLEQELDLYARRKTLPSFAISPTGLRPGSIEIHPLTAGEAAIMPIRIRLRLDPDAEQVRDLLAQTRALATQFPSEPAVLSTLAEAEYDLGEDKEAITAADAAISADPARVDAYVQKGLALFHIAEGTGDAKAYAAARSAFAALSEREPDHPLPLVYFFRSYLAQRQAPPPLAVQKMLRAVELAPFDLTLRMNLALQQLRQGEATAARENLRPVAYDPHGGALAAQARAVLARLDSGPGPQDLGLQPTKPGHDPGAAMAPGQR